MSDADGEPATPVSRRNRLAAAIASIMLGVLAFVPLAFNIMAFDAPGSDRIAGTYVWVLGLISISPLAVLGDIATLITKRMIFLLAPSIGLVFWIFGRVLESLAI